MAPEENSVVIIGGGLAGLAAGERLTAAGRNVLILEHDTDVGGMAKSFLHDGRWIPITYHHVMKSDTMTIRYLDKFNMLKTVRWANSPQSVWYDHRRYLLSKASHLFGFSPLSPREKIRLGMFGLYCLFKRNWDNLSTKPCDEWLEERLGSRTSTILFENLVTMKYGIPVRNVSTAWLGMRLHRSVLTHDRYGYPAAGFQPLLDVLERTIIAGGGRIQTNTAVVSISKDGIEIVDRSTGKKKLLSPAKIISTVAPPLLLQMTNSPQALIDQFKTISYKALISYVFASDKVISETYWNIMLHPLISFGGFFNHGVLNPTGKEQLYYTFSYTDRDDPFYQLSDEELQQRFIADLRSYFPGFNVTWGRIFKIDYSQPVYVKDYANPAVKTGVHDIYLAGIYKEFPEPRTIHSAIKSGLKAADAILSGQ